ncbi:MAG: hypothetical protein HQ511_12305 [Rhodospirillales bacterium]|nr:hypothetical protein [Rhodospirillales bacterium]
MAEPEDYQLLVEREWADLHHSRVQEWTALGVVAGAHLGLIQLSKLAIDVELSTVTILTVATMTGALFSILGALMTCRHRRLRIVKLGWIYDAELHLGLVKTADTPKGVIPENAKMLSPVEWKGLSVPRLLSTSGLILAFYAVFFAVDISVAVWIWV